MAANVVRVLLLLCLLPQVAPAQLQPGARQDQRLALTFDDLPLTGPAVCDPDSVRDVTAALTGALQARSLPSAGLVVPGRECLGAGLLQESLRRWQEAGAIIGNHTATHPDFNTTSVAAYLADIDRAQGIIDRAVKTDSRWFRAPLLHTGDTQRKQRRLKEHLSTNGYRVAPVTVDNQEWVYAAVYADARDRHDRVLASRVADAYLAHLEDAMAFYERLSMRVFDREVPQILLLHANLLNAEQLPRVVEMLASRGYRFTSLPEAVSDPAYARGDPYIGARGLSWLQRWALEDGLTIPDEPREAAWVAEAFRAIRQRRDR